MPQGETPNWSHPEKSGCEEERVPRLGGAEAGLALGTCCVFSHQGALGRVPTHSLSGTEQAKGEFKVTWVPSHAKITQSPLCIFAKAPSGAIFLTTPNGAAIVNPPSKSRHKTL